MRYRTFLTMTTAAAALLLLSESATAQDCGDWYRPVVCTAEIVATDSGRDTIRLDERSDLELGPNEEIDLQLEARDQRGARFPIERLALRYDDYDCRSILRVEDREEGSLRIGATASEGRCRLEIWMPNNLNFEWELDIQISVGARSGYERAEAEILANALYVAILNREPDSGGFSGAVAEIQSGNLDAQIDAMTRSTEFHQAIADKTAPDVLEQFYVGIFGRPGDSAGVRLYLAEMQRGQYASVLRKLIRSPEFEARLQR